MRTFPDWLIPEWVQPISNSSPSCAWCEANDGTHRATCGRADFIAEYRRLVRIVAGVADILAANYEAKSGIR